MQRWTGFALGIMAGVIAVLLAVVVAQNMPAADASAPPATLPQGTDNTGGGLMMATGGATSQQQDILWVVFKRPAARKAGADSKDITAKDEKISLCTYQVQTGGRQIKLVGARDISYDMDLLEYQCDKPHVKEIVEALKKQLPADK